MKCALLGIALLAFLPQVAAAQIPDEFVNLRVLDPTIEEGELIGVMRGFAGALGVRCNFCHPGGEGGSLQGVDFVTDENPHKKVARTMLQMTQALNAEWIPKAHEGEGDPVRVECMSCHRGQEKPRMIADVLAQTQSESGLEGTKAKYSELRDEYYGRHTFDFGESVLISLAEGMAESGDLDGAKDLLSFNLGFFPESSITHTMLGRVLLQNDETEQGIAHLEQAVALDPQNSFAQRLLQRAKGSDQ